MIDVDGDGFSLTKPSDGVFFDLRPDGVPELLSWTPARGDDAWLVLDRNGNGKIDNGLELFGNHTEQPPIGMPNGFAALKVFDRNRDLWIDKTDEVYRELRLWTDSNHDGVSQADELRSLPAAGLLRISLEVKKALRRDKHGNRYRFRAKIVSDLPGEFGPFAYDVFLLVDAPRGHQSNQNQSYVAPPWLRGPTK